MHPVLHLSNFHCQKLYGCTLTNVPIKLYGALVQTANLYPANIQQYHDGFAAFLCVVRFASFFNKLSVIFYSYSGSEWNIVSCYDLLMWSIFWSASSFVSLCWVRSWPRFFGGGQSIWIESTENFALPSWTVIMLHAIYFASILLTKPHFTTSIRIFMMQQDLSLLIIRTWDQRHFQNPQKILVALTFGTWFCQP